MNPKKINLNDERYICVHYFSVFHPWLAGPVALGSWLHGLIVAEGVVMLQSCHKVEANCRIKA